LLGLFFLDVFKAGVCFFWRKCVPDKRYLMQFKAATGFKVVLEFSGEEELNQNIERVKEADLTWERLQGFNLNFDQADLFMDMRSPECIEQFDLEDWL
jgi:hypothetical protein